MTEELVRAKGKILKLRLKSEDGIISRIYNLLRKLNYTYTYVSLLS